MENENKNLKQSKTKGNANEASGPIIFGIVAVLLMALAAHFFGN